MTLGLFKCSGREAIMFQKPLLFADSVSTFKKKLWIYDAKWKHVVEMHLRVKGKCYSIVIRFQNIAVKSPLNDYSAKDDT